MQKVNTFNNLANICRILATFVKNLASIRINLATFAKILATLKKLPLNYAKSQHLIKSRLL